MPLTMTRADSVHTNAVYGPDDPAVLEDEKPDYLRSPSTCLRRLSAMKSKEAYKGNRVSRSAEFHEQVPFDEGSPEKNGHSVSGERRLGMISWGRWVRISENTDFESLPLVSGDPRSSADRDEEDARHYPQTKAGVTTYEQYDEDGVKVRWA